jgi:hypothetical protein
MKSDFLAWIGNNGLEWRLNALVDYTDGWVLALAHYGAAVGQELSVKSHLYFIMTQAFGVYLRLSA